MGAYKECGGRSLAAANVAFISVDGHSGYGKFITRYLDAFGIPWVIVSDGPSPAQGGRKLSGVMLDLGHWPETAEPVGENFDQWRKFWEQAGVFTLAKHFGDDGKARYEGLEALLRRG